MNKDNKLPYVLDRAGKDNKLPYVLDRAGKDNKLPYVLDRAGKDNNEIIEEFIKITPSWANSLIGDNKQSCPTCGIIPENLEKLAEALKQKDSKLKEVVKLANNALYFDDSSDYCSALWKILKEINPDTTDELKYIE